MQYNYNGIINFEIPVLYVRIPKFKFTKFGGNWEIGKLGLSKTKLDYLQCKLTTLKIIWNIVTSNLGRAGNVGNMD